MKTAKQKQPKLPVPDDTATPLRCNFSGKERRAEMLDSVRAQFRAMDKKIVLSAHAVEAVALWGLGIHADLEPADARAITKQLRDAMALRRRISGGYSNLMKPRSEMRYCGVTFEASYASDFLPQIAASVRFAKDRILLELHGSNARVRLWLDSVIADALIFDLERAIQAVEEFR